MTISIPQSVDSASTFFDFAERHALALHKVHKGKKNPVGDGWETLSTKDRTQWEAWIAEGYNIGINPGASGIAVCDVEAGNEQTFKAWCNKLGFEPPSSHTTSPSGGFHVFFKFADSASFKKQGLEKTGWGDLLTGNANAVCAPSYFANVDNKPGKKAGHYKWTGVTVICDGTALPPALEKSAPRGAVDLSRLAPDNKPPISGGRAEWVLKEECEALRTLDGSGSHPVLLRGANHIGTHVGAGNVGAMFAYDALAEAFTESGVSSDGWERAIRDGIENGAATPAWPDRTLEEMFGSVVADLAAKAGTEISKHKPPRYFFETVADLRNLPAAKWLVDGWIPEQGVGLFYGAYASGKSFILFDLMLHLAYGIKEWHGVKLPGIPRNVLLIAREGSKGFEGRVDAFKANHGITDDTDRMVFMRSPTNMGDRAQFAELKTAVESSGRKFGVVGFDTVGRALPGEDFYDPKSITAFMENLQQLGEIGDGVAIGVHHENKSGDIFGSVYFGASSDFMFQVEREGDPKKDPLRRGKITCTKMKDGEDGWKKRVDYQKVANSLVVASIGEAVGLMGESKKLSPDDKLALRALGEAIREVGKARPEMPGRSVTINEWLDQCFKIGGVSPDAAKPTRDLHRRQVNLLASGLILVQDNLVKIIDQVSAANAASAVGLQSTMIMPGAIPLPPIPQRPYQ